MFKKGETIRVSEIVQHIPDAYIHGDDQIAISGIKIDSRQISSGDLFVAIRGEHIDGHRFIKQAIERGAAAVVGSKGIDDLSVPYIQVVDSRIALAYASAAYFGFPARQMVIIGVTGTDGKTTTSHIIRSILRKAGLKTGMISTVNAMIGDVEIDTGYHVTTPESPDVQYLLRRMADEGITHVVIEATSHGLAQHRVTACEFDIGVVTNVTHEHLDYHKSYENYLAAKGQLFRSLDLTKPKSFQNAKLISGAVLNKDDQAYSYLSRITNLPQVSYSVKLEEMADIIASEIQIENYGMSFVVSTNPKFNNYQVEKFDQLRIYTQLIGSYNVANCLAAIGVTSSLLGIEEVAIQKGLAEMESIPGRMEEINMGQDFNVVVDFAHTPNALENALKAARLKMGGKPESGRLIAVFGSAGLRDRDKRRMMATRSYQLADFTILTAEDPRTEPLEEIIDEMALGIRKKGGEEGVHFMREPDRREAIRTALKMAKAGDLVIICGKGHERSMCFGEIEYPWDDRKAASAALAELLNIEGPEMPFLPT